MIPKSKGNKWATEYGDRTNCSCVGESTGSSNLGPEWGSHGELVEAQQKDTSTFQR